MRPQAAAVKEPLTGSQLHVGGHMTSPENNDTLKRRSTAAQAHRWMGGGVTVLLLDQSLVEGRRGWDGRCGGVQVLAVLAGTGPSGSHCCSWKKSDGQTSKSEWLPVRRSDSN